jgi:hypothetical protein
MNVREGFVDHPTSQPVANGGKVPIIDESPIDAAPPPTPVEVWPVRVKLLHKPVKNMRGESVDELVFREPTGGDINRYGNPCRINSDGEVMIDEPKMARVMAALCGILLPNLEAMDPRDWNSCAYRLRNFFLPEVAAW